MTVAHINTKQFALSEALSEYLNNKFIPQENFDNKSLYDFDFDIWSSLELAKTDNEVFSFLTTCYPQLGFAIQKGISQTTSYKNSVYKGYQIDNLIANTSFLNTENIHIEIYKSFAGNIPVFKCVSSASFTFIIQALLHKNEPIEIPDSMGAVLINGIANWKKIGTIKKEWYENNPICLHNDFHSFLQQNSSLYKDQLIILSSKNYSNITPEKLGLSPEKWKEYSYTIRKEHECTHLYTLKKYGNASNNLHDELIADYIGIIATKKVFEKKWLLTFLGLEEYPKYRIGARLENYIKTIKIDSPDFMVITYLMYNAIENLALFHNIIGNLSSETDLYCRIDTLCETSLLYIASSNGHKILVTNYKQKIFQSQSEL